LSGRQGDSDIELVDGSGGYARHESYELLVVASDESELANLCAVDGGALLGSVLELHLQRGFLDGNRLGDIADFQFRVHGQFIVDIQDHAFKDRFLKPGDSTVTVYVPTTRLVAA